MVRKHTPQTPHRRKPCAPTASGAAISVKPRGVFRAFSNYRLFAIVGALVLFGGYGISAFSGGTISAHGGGGAGSGSSVRGEDVVRRETPTESADEPARAVATIKQYSGAPPLTIDASKRYVATIKTSRGDVVVELLPTQAPQAVNNFVFLTRDGFYDGVTFHRVIPGFVAQAGDPTGTGIGGPGYDLTYEANDAAFETGVLAVARPSEAGSPNNGSQFFFALGREPTLDGSSTVFGRVVEGMEVLKSLTPRDPQRDENAGPGEVIETITITEEQS